MPENIPIERSLEERIALHREAISDLETRIPLSRRDHSPGDIRELEKSLSQHKAELDKLLRQCPDDVVSDTTTELNHGQGPEQREIGIGSTGIANLPHRSQAADAARDKAMAELRKILK